MLRNLASILSIACLCAIPTVSRADTIYNLNATLENGDKVSGTVSFQNVTVPSAGIEVDGDNFTIVTSTDSLVGTYNDAYFIGSTGEVPYVEFFAQGTESDIFPPFFELAIPGTVPLPEGFAGGAICSDDNPCGGVLSASTMLGTAGGNVVSGSLTAPTPEPSSLALLGTGLIGAFGLARRKFGKA